MKAAPFRIIRIASRMLLNRLRILLLTALSIIIRLFCRGKKLLSRHKKYRGRKKRFYSRND